MRKVSSWGHPGVLESLEQGELFIGPTDTILGLMGCISDVVFQKLNIIKQRHDKPYVCLFSSYEKAQQVLVPQSLHIENFLQKCWPGPITIVLPRRADLPAYVGSSSTVAVRVPDHAGLQVLLKQLPMGLFSTSANRAGHPPVQSVAEVDTQLSSACAFAIEDKQGVGVPSTIIDCTQGAPRLIRQGAVPFEQIQHWYDQARG